MEQQPNTNRALRHVREVVKELRQSTVSDYDFALTVVQALDTVSLLRSEHTDEKRWHLIDAGEHGVKAARYPNTVHHGPLEAVEFNGIVAPHYSLSSRADEWNR